MNPLFALTRGCRRLGPVLALVVGLQTLSSATALAQAPSLARYVPDKDLLFYLEFQGLDADPAAWKGSALAQVLEETKTGAMMEDLLAQVFDQSIKPVAPFLAKLSGAECVSLLKHIARSGFVVALSGKPGVSPDEVFGVVVFRKAFQPETKATYGKILGAINATGKASMTVKAGHKVVSVVDEKLGPRVDWWVDDAKKEDLILSLRPINTAKILETIDGSAPSAVDNKTRAALLKSAGSMSPAMVMFLEGGFFKTAQLPPALGLAGLERLEYVWGFEGKTTVSIMRIVAPKPRRGLLALFDQPTFQKAAMLPVPEGVETFSAASLDAGKLLDDLTALAASFEPKAEERVKAMLDDVAAKTKIHIKEDVLAQIGPRMVFYNSPSKPSGGFNPLSALTGGAEIPKITIVAEVQNPKAFVRTLDALMIEVNKQLRTAVPTAPPEAGGEAASKRRRPEGSGLEFKPVPTPNSADRAYMLSVPSQLAAILPSSIRPTVRLHDKSLIISMAADSARQAAELKGPGAAGKDFAEALKPIDGELVGVSVDDPRKTVPALLASLPGKVQALANRAAAGPAGLAPPGFGGPGAGPGIGSAPPAGQPGDGAEEEGRRGGSKGNTLGGEPTSPGPQGVPVPPGGGPAAPGGAPAPGAAVVFSVDPDKMPKADEIAPLLFPNTMTVTLSDSAIIYTTRESFPNIAPLFNIPALGSLPGMGGPGGPPPGGTPPPGFGPASGPGLAPPGGSSGGASRPANKLID
ncbi:MAG: hypothetical protein SFX72_01830 [Isosphaeraceae bacterium]|nr:hypothetical protein [Isosphaeraceae bacterium]